MASSNVTSLSADLQGVELEPRSRGEGRSRGRGVEGRERRWGGEREGERRKERRRRGREEGREGRREGGGEIILVLSK